MDNLPPIRITKYLKRLVLERDQYICRECGIETLRPEEAHRLPHVHHLDGHQDHNELDNLVTNCASCHNSSPKELPKVRVSLLTAIFKDRFLKPVQVAELLGLHRKTIIRWIYRGWINATTTPGGHYIISQQEAERLKGLFNGKPDHP